MNRKLGLCLFALCSLGFCFAQVRSDLAVAEKHPATTTLIFGSYGNSVSWWDAAGTIEGTISGLSSPQGLDTDANSNLYVANGGAGTVLIYATPYTGEPTTLSDPGYFPGGVAQFNKGEYVAVTNVISNSGGAGNLLLFKNGELVATITNSSFKYYNFCAWDSAGNLYVTGQNSSRGTVIGKVPDATKGKTTLNVLKTANSIALPGGIQVTHAGLIAIVDQGSGSGSTIYTYNPPVDGKLGSPVSTISLTGSRDILGFAFLSSDDDVWAADSANTAFAFAEWAYPAGGSNVKSVKASGGGVGVAVVPRQAP
jgi:hypothetical protein